MGLLSHEEKQLLFDHCMGLASEQQDDQAELLIASNPDAANFYYEQLKAQLSPLESLEREPCPDSLAEQTVRMLTERAHAHDEPKSSDKTDVSPVASTPAAAPQNVEPPVIRANAWRSPVQIAAVAAILLFLVSVSVPALGMMRENMRRTQCKQRLGQVFLGMRHYVSDFGRAPSVKTVSGEPWWKVGDQGSQNHSNTRNAWLLAKQSYVEPENFLCPSRKTKRQPNLKTLRSENLQDFPSRSYIDFSSRVYCEKTQNQTTGSTPLMADMNPLAERLPSDHSGPLQLFLDKDILRSNSLNHGGRGQNILLNDGSVRFSRTRSVSPDAPDDIFILQSMILGTAIMGYEVPDCASDAFLAP
jgi:hypothetical protein